MLDATAAAEAVSSRGWPAEEQQVLCDDPRLIKAELWSIERRFRRLGVPTFQAGFNSTRSIFVPALPMLVVAFVIQMLLAFDLVFHPHDWWWFTGPLIAGTLLVTFLVLLGNVARGQKFLSWPARVGWFEVAIFVLLPTAVDWAGGDGMRGGLVTASQQIVILVLAWLIFALGLVPLVLWTGQRFLDLLRSSGRVLIKAVPLMIFFSFLLFFTEEIWTIFGQTGPLHIGLATLMFVGVAGFFIAVHIPANIDDMERIGGGPPLNEQQRLNIGVLVFITLALQIIFVGVLVFVFFAVLGAVLMPDNIADRWTHGDVQTIQILTLSFSVQLLKVAEGTALISALYYSVAIWLDDMYRDEVLEHIADSMKPTLQLRTRYLALLKRLETMGSDVKWGAGAGDYVARLVGRPQKSQR